MLSCPVCGSSRIRNDFKPAPLALRILFIRKLLCDYCNHQFKAFSISGATYRSHNRAARKVSALDRAPAAKVVDLNRLKDATAAKGSKALVQRDQPRRLTMDLAALRLRSKTQQEVAGAIVSDHRARIPQDLRTEITKIQEQGAKDQNLSQSTEQAQPEPSTVISCAHCGSTNVKRRRRKLLERIAFSFSGHKAFTCNSCSEPFYSKVEDNGTRNGSIGASEPSG